MNYFPAGFSFCVDLQTQTLIFYIFYFFSRLNSRVGWGIFFLLLYIKRIIFSQDIKNITL